MREKKKVSLKIGKIHMVENVQRPNISDQQCRKCDGPDREIVRELRRRCRDAAASKNKTGKR